jgi:ubiquinone/menaquinone biosynthesis C-methylase UbiE
MWHERVPFETSHTAVERELLDRALGHGARVLEIGCGRTTRLVEHRARIAELVGVDVDHEAGRENPYLDRFLEADACAPLPFADGEFDLVYANFVIEHLCSPAEAFCEWRRVVRAGGELVVLTSNVANPLLLMARLLPQHVRVLAKRHGAGAAERDVFPAVYRANTVTALAAAMAEARFRPAELRTVATLHRYAGSHRRTASALSAAERLLPAARRSTIVAEFRAA